MPAPAPVLPWEDVAKLSPQLRGHVHIHRHRYRGQTWYVVQDSMSGRFHRFSADAYRIIGLMDGQRTVEDIFQSLQRQLDGGQAPAQDELVALLAKLHAAELLHVDTPGDPAESYVRQAQNQRRLRLRRLLNPLAIRFPLLDPDQLLNRWTPRLTALFSLPAVLLGLMVTVAALGMAAAHWPELVFYATSRALDPRNLLLIWLTYPLVKALHEAGHALAVKVWGGEVHEVGVLLLVLMPVPYVDATAASAFADKRKRMAVGTAGIVVEVLLAALAMFVWLNVQPGLVQDIAFNVMLVSGVSTLLFNGNPLLRFDGYYVLADAVEIPNLGPRSTQYLAYLIQRYLFGLPAARSPVVAAGESAWFLAYGLASGMYRIVIMFVIALFVASKLFVIGVLLAIWVLTLQLVYPLIKSLHFVLASPALRDQRPRALMVLGVMSVVLAAVLLYPLPSWTLAQGVIRLPEDALVRAATDGFVVRGLAPAGSHVKRGEALIETEDPLLRARVSLLEAKILELKARQANEGLEDRVQGEIVRQEIATVEAELDDIRARAVQLVIHSPADGTLVVPTAADLSGRFVRQGDPLAYVTDRSRVSARVVVPQSDIGRVRGQTRAVQVRLANRPREVLPAVIEQQTPSATRHLPSRVLGSAGGGSIAVDMREAEGTTALQRVFQFDLGLPPRPVGHYAVGARVYVRFEHGRESIARRAYLRVRQLLLNRFNA